VVGSNAVGVGGKVNRHCAFSVVSSHFVVDTIGAPELLSPSDLLCQNMAKNSKQLTFENSPA
jgi:hypothetical protein